MPQGLAASMIANAILYAGEPQTQEFEAETVTSLAPGRLVITNTAAYQIQAGTASSIIVLGIADVPSDKQLTSMQAEGTVTGVPTTTFTAGNQVRVLRGNIEVKGLLKSGQTITVGEKLECAALGMLQTLSATKEACVGYALENLTTTTTCKWILFKMTI